MKRKPPFTCVIFISFALIASCAETRHKNSGGTASNRPFAGDYQKLILGTWKIVAIHCDSEGNNCEWYTGRRIFRFSPNGDLTVNDIRRGTYRLEGPVCILDAGSRKYAVNILRLDSSILVTGESHRVTTEIFKKLN